MAIMQVAGARRPLLRRGMQVLLAVFLVCIVAASGWQLRQVWTFIPAGWSDLYPQWTAVKAALHGKDPYSRSVTEEIQRGFYGHVLGPKEQERFDAQNFVYPAHLALLLGPFTWLPWWLVRLLFTALAPPAVGAALWAWLKFCGIGLRGLGRTVAYILILSSWPAVWAYQQTQPTIYVAALVAFSVLLFQRRRDGWSGLLLALATTKPNLVGLVVVWLTFQALIQRRWRWLGSFGVSVAALILGAETLVPGWISEWIRTVILYGHDPRKVSLLARFFGRYHTPATALVVALLCVQLWRSRAARGESPEFGRVMAVLLAFTVCTIPTTPWMIYNDLLLIPCVLVLVQEGFSRNLIVRTLRFVAIAAIVCLVLATPVSDVLEFLMPHRAFGRALPWFVGEFVPMFFLIALLADGLSRPAGEQSYGAGRFVGGSCTSEPYREPAQVL